MSCQQSQAQLRHGAAWDPTAPQPGLRSGPAVRNGCSAWEGRAKTTSLKITHLKRAVLVQCSAASCSAAGTSAQLPLQITTWLSSIRLNSQQKKMSFPQSSLPPGSTQAEGTRGSSLQAHQQQQPPGLPGPCSGWVGSEHTAGDNSCTCFLKVLKKTAEWLRFWVGIRRKTVLFCLFPKKEKKFLKNVFELLV